MTIKIGERSFSTRKPKDLDEALEQATGCNAAETGRILAGYPNAGQVAAAVRPFLPEDAPSVIDLAADIGTVDADLLAAVRKLYADEVAASASGDDA